MGAIWFVARRDLRRHCLATVGITLLVGLVGTVALSTVAGARRSDSALRRFNTYSRSADIEISPGAATSAQLTEFRRTPGIAAVAVMQVYALRSTSGIQNLAVGAPLDGVMNRDVDRPRLIAGRVADPRVADEVDIGESLAAIAHLRIGETLDFASWSPAQVASAYQLNRFPQPAGPALHLRIVGIVRRPLDLGERGDAGGVVTLTAAFNAKYGRLIDSFNGLAMRARTTSRAAVPAVTARAQQIFGHNRNFDLQSLSIDNTGAADAIHVLAIALMIFAAVAAVAGVGAIALVLSRELSFSRAVQPAMIAIGASRRQRIAMTGVRAGVIAGLGAILSVVGAVLVSPLFPFGVARRADPDPGFHVDALVLIAGAAAILLVVAVIGGVAGVRATRSAAVDRAGRRTGLASRTVEAGMSSGLPVSAAAGLRMALDPGRGQRAVPVRSALFAGMFAVSGLTAVAVFAASLGHLAATPRLYGSTFDFRVVTTSDPWCNRSDHGITRLGGIESLAAVCYENIQVGSHTTTGWGEIALRGANGPEIVAGRMAETPTEIVLGAATLRAVHKAVGDTVEASLYARHAVYRIVGRAVFPTLGDAQPLADGAWFTQPGFDTLLGPAEAQRDGGFSRYLVGTYSPAANRAALDAHIAENDFDVASGAPARPSGPRRPVEVTRLRQTNWFPGAIAGLLAFLAIAAVGHALVAGTRRRRRELALLKTLGFERGQVRGAIAFQATALATGSLLVGVPLGLLAGQAIWRAIANGLGVADVVVVPVLVPMLVPVVLLVMNAVAFFPARAAARMPPAVALRSE
jgi:hypothetical protein